MEGVSLTVISDTLTPALKRLAANLSAAPGAMDSIANWLKKSTLQNFMAEGRPTGNWPRLADSTAKGYVTEGGKRTGRKRRGYGHMLRVTAGGGGLMGSIQTRSTAMMAEIGTTKKYAGAHQEGTDKAGRNRNVTIPKRTFIGASDNPDPKHQFILIKSDEDAIAKIIDKHIAMGQGQ